MRFELRKLLTSPQLCLLLILVLAANGALYWSVCTDDSQGYTMSEIRAAYEDPDAMAELRERLAEDTSDNAWLEEILGGLIQQWGRSLDDEMLDRIEQAENYQQYREGLVSESRMKLMLGLFGDSFSAQSLELGIQEYEALSGVIPVVAFSGGIEMLAAAHHTDLLLLVFAGIAGLILLTYEKNAGLSKLTRPTRRGGSRLWLRKWAAMLLLYSVGFIVLYGTNVAITAALFGFSDLSRPVQSVFGYNGCSMALSVGEFLGSLLGLKYLWGLTCSALVFCLCALAGSTVAAGAGTAVCAAAALLLWRSPFLWARAVSLLGVARMERAFQGAVYLNWFGRPIHQIPFTIIFCAAIICVCFLAGLWAFCRTPQTSDGGGKWLVSWSLPHRYTALFRHEGYKALVMLRAAAVLAVFLIVQVISYQDFYVLNSEFEHYYRNYSSILNGDPNAEKDAYLEREQARLDDLDRQWQELQMQYPNSASVMGSDIQNALRAREPFEKALRQYRGLEEGQSYLYQTKYERLFGARGIQNDLENLTKLFLILTFALFRLFAVERESRVEVLQATARRKRDVLVRKLILTAVIVILANAIAFLPQYIVVFRGYGGPELTAAANSIQLLSALPGWCTVWMVLMAATVVRLILAGMVAAMIAVVSAKTGNSIVTLIVTLVVLAILLSGAFLWFG